MYDIAFMFPVFLLKISHQTAFYDCKLMPKGSNIGKILGINNIARTLYSTPVFLFLQDIVQETLPKEKKNANHVLLKQSNLEHYTSSLVSPKLARQTPQSPHAMSNERKVLDGLYMFYSTYIFEVVKYCINNGLLMFYNALKNE